MTATTTTQGVTLEEQIALAMDVSINCRLGIKNEPVEIVHGIGRWLSAALEDDHVCDSMKKDIEAWMDATK